MSRLPFADSDASPEVATLAHRIRTERGGKLLKLYRVLLHSPKVAGAWLNFFTVIRQQCTLEPRIRELVILLIARLNRAQYEFDQHVPFGLRAGLKEDQIAAVADWRAHVEKFDQTELAVMAYAESMTGDIQVPDDVFDAVRRRFSNDEIVELTATIAGYNMVSRFLEALQVHQE